MGVLEISAGVFADNFAPEGLGGEVFIDLGDKPAPGEAVKGSPGGALTDFIAAVFVQDEKFCHVVDDLPAVSLALVAYQNEPGELPDPPG